MKKIIAVLFVCLLSSALSAQTPESVQRAEMEKLRWIIGNWKGTGWIQRGPQGKKEFIQTETIEGKLDGLVLIIEGRGTSKEDGCLVHNALAVVSYDERAKTFRWRAFTHEGRQTDAVAKVGANSLEWGLDLPERGRVKYTLTRGKNGEWVEVGEMTQDGQTWHKFFEMILRKDP